MSPSDSVDLVLVLDTDGTPLEVTEMEATSLQTLLEANGIESEIVGAEMMPNLPYRLQVPADQAKQAAEIIAEARATGSEGADEAEQAGEEEQDNLPPAT
jgi:regulator of protease activity HflC (stomatin/prohibitin superfamily)